MRIAFIIAIVVSSSGAAALPALASPDDTLPPATTPAEALATLRTMPGLAIELVAAEPLVIDPIAVEFGTDGRLWVVEMRDYPMGMDGNWKPGGIIKTLADTNGDGTYDKGTVFMDGIPFPSGVMPWKKGALICTAPDILYAEDTDGDGRADLVRKILTGFATDNYQARVNSLSLGLDNWIYAANGLLGGVIRGQSPASEPVNISGRDIRLHPDTGVFEPVSGLTQFGRVRDDWGNWFGCNNSRPLLHYPMPDRYIRRNPHVAAPRASIDTTEASDENRVYPLSQPLTRFNEPDSLNNITAGCGLGLYRDNLLGEEFYGDAFVCEPVHSLVTRLKIAPRGATFSAHRAPDEQTSEFLASTSLWFTPVQSRPGPDGALWVVDMVRPILEHPRFIPPERLARLDVRAGDDKGRIFRVVPRRVELRPIRDLTKLPLPDLVAALDTPNGIARDLAHLEIIFRNDDAAIPLLAALFRASSLPAVRIQALAAIDGLRGMTTGLVETALRDVQPPVRRFALRLSEQFIVQPSALDQRLPALATDADLGVRYQLALTLGEWHDARAAARVLGRIANNDLRDPWVRSAVVSSATKDAVGILETVLTSEDSGVDKGRLAADLIATAIAESDDVDAVLLAAAPRDGDALAGWNLIALAGLQDAFDARGMDLALYRSDKNRKIGAAMERMRKAYASAVEMAKAPSAGMAEREAAIRLLTSGFNDFDANFPILISFLEGGDSSLMPSVVRAIRRSASPLVPGLLLGHWNRFPPSLRSTVLDILVSRDDWMGQLLTGLERGAVPITAVPAASRQRLLRHARSDTRARAQALFAAGASTNRQRIVDEYRSVRSKPGDIDKGAQVFANACATCHVFAGRSLGPALASFRNKSAEDFLVAILDPNAAIEAKFTGYIITMKAGGTLAGTISAESATSFTIMMPGNVTQDVLRSEVASITALDRSFMPEGLESSLTLQDMADLIAYIAASRDSAGSAP